MNKIMGLCDEAAKHKEYHNILDILWRFPLGEFTEHVYMGNVRDAETDEVETIEGLKSLLCTRIDNIVKDLKEDEELKS